MAHAVANKSSSSRKPSGGDNTAETQLVEYASNATKLRVDATTGIISGVKIIGHTSRNGRTYLPEAISRAKSKYENAPVNIDHARKADEPRGMRDRIGSIRAVEERADGLYGNLHLNPKHAMFEQVAWEAENNPGNFGLSHVANGRTKNAGGKTIVEEILSVTSVDLVTDPATTRGLFEHVEGTDQMELVEALAKVNELTTEAATLKEQLTAKTGEVTTLTEQLKTLKESAATAKAAADLAAHKAAVDKLLSESKLPEAAIGKAFKETLYEATADRAKELIAEHVTAFKVGGVKSVSGGAHVQESVRRSGSGNPANDSPADSKSFATGLLKR